MVSPGGNQPIFVLKITNESRHQTSKFSSLWIRLGCSPANLISFTTNRKGAKRKQQLRQTGRDTVTYSIFKSFPVGSDCLFQIEPQKRTFIVQPFSSQASTFKFWSKMRSENRPKILDQRTSDRNFWLSYNFGYNVSTLQKFRLRTLWSRFLGLFSDLIFDKKKVDGVRTKEVRTFDFCAHQTHIKYKQNWSLQIFCSFWMWARCAWCVHVTLLGAQNS